MKILPFILLTAAGLLAQNTYYLPQIADGVVANGSLSTTLALANIGKTTATVTIAASRDDASPRPLTISGLGSSSRFSVKLAPGATRLFVTDGSGDGTAGAAVVTSDVPLSVSEILSNADPAGNPLSESTAQGLEDIDLGLEYLIAVDATASMDTGVALYNPGKTPATVTLKLLDTTVSTTITLAPQGRTTRFVRSDLFPGIGDFRGTLDVSSAARLAAVAVRRNAASPAYTLLPAVSSRAHRLRFFLPRIADGPSVQTTFLLTNVSAKPAAVTLSLTGDDGSPLDVGVPDSATIAPGASVFLQSGGASDSLVSGTAAIRSTQPIAAAAVVTAANGETALWPAPLDFQFIIPFDSAHSSGPAIWNPGRRPVALKLSLADPDGKPLASAQLPPLAGGTRLTGAISDFFPGVSAASGAIAVSTATLIDGFISAVAPAARLPMIGSGQPRAVTPTLDKTRQATASIPPSGGTLTVTDAKGNRFTLTLPSGALLNRETITMTPISSATGLAGPGLVAGVQLEPDGLGLYQPALLKIELASPAPAGTYPIGWRGQTPGIYLNTPLPDPKSLTLMLAHFSGAGMGGADLTSDLISIANGADYYQSLVSAAIARGRQAQLSGLDSSGDGATVEQFQEQWYENVVLPMMELAQASDDEDVMRCALTFVIGYQRQRELMGQSGGDADAISAEDQAMTEWSNYVTQRYVQKLDDRCKKHDFTAFFEILAAQRQSLLSGIPAPTADPNSCLPALQLDYTSQISGTITIGVGGTYDATISAKKVVLPGSLTKTVLTQITDPAKDLYTSFTVAGSGPETYDSLSLTVNNVPAGCSVSIASKIPSTMTVKTGDDPKLSQVQFKFNPNYQPQAQTARGQQLCSFCPVYRKTPVKVELWVDPGKPAESILTTCPSAAATIPANFWWAGWAQNHASAGDNGFIQGWDMQADPTFSAQKDITQHYVSPAGDFKEKTTLKLKPYTE